MRKSRKFKRNRLETFLESFPSRSYFASWSDGLCARSRLYLFFPSENLFFNFPNLNGINCSLKLCKNLAYRAHSRAKDSHVSLAGALIEKQYCILGMRARLFAWLRVLRAVEEIIFICVISMILIRKTQAKFIKSPTANAYHF